MSELGQPFLLSPKTVKSVLFLLGMYHPTLNATLPYVGKSGGHRGLTHTLVRTPLCTRQFHDVSRAAQR
jgi:hypothetical protein